MSRKQSRDSRLLLIITVITTLVPLLAYLTVDFLYGGRAEYNQARGNAAFVVMLISFMALLILIFASIKLETTRKKVALIGIALCLLVAILSYVTKWFAGYAN